MVSGADMTGGHTSSEGMSIPFETPCARCRTLTYLSMTADGPCSAALDPVAKIPEYKVCAVAVEAAVEAMT